MNFAFATCNRGNALAFLRKLYPSSDLQDTPECAKDLLDLIEADEIRVCDPDFHSGSIIQGKNWNDRTHANATAALKKTGVWFSATQEAA